MNFTTANFNPPASADDVWALLAKNSVPLAAARVSLADAAGRILREDVCAPEDQPAFDRSSVDGFAVRLDDAAESFCVVDEIRAGDWKPRTLQPGEAVRLATGGALPSDGLQVVMKEDVTLDGSTLHVTRRSRATNIRVRGEDARREQVLLSAGAELSPGALALLASVGAAQPLVTRLPRVLHLATGNEIVAPDQTPARGQIRDSNSTLVRAFVRHWNAALVQQRLPEDESAVRAVLGSFFEKPAALPLPSPLPLGEGTDSRALKNSDATRASDATELAKTRQTHLPLPAGEGRGEGESAEKFQRIQPDLVLISGGASVGEHDFTRRLLVEAGFEILVSKTNLRPGKPLIVARRGATLAFGLPGNPLAHFMCLNLFVRAALNRLCGVEKSFMQRGQLAVPLTDATNARETFWPARVDFSGGGARLTPLRWSSSGDLTALASANALLRVAPNQADLPAGTTVEFIPTV